MLCLRAVSKVDEEYEVYVNGILDMATLGIIVNCGLEDVKALRMVE